MVEAALFELRATLCLARTLAYREICAANPAAAKHPRLGEWLEVQLIRCLAFEPTVKVPSRLARIAAERVMQTWRESPAGQRAKADREGEALAEATIARIRRLGNPPPPAEEPRR
jgi:hypothetical protein